MDKLVDLSTAARLCGIKPATLRAYESRGEPKKCPFPEASPEHETRVGNRIVRHWPASQVLEWNARRLANNRVKIQRNQLWVDRAGRISGAIPPDNLRRVVRIETISHTDGGDLIGVVGWWQRKADDGGLWIDDSPRRHSAVRGDMWHRRMTFLADA